MLRSLRQKIVNNFYPQDDSSDMSLWGDNEIIDVIISTAETLLVYLSKMKECHRCRDPHVASLLRMTYKINNLTPQDDNKINNARYQDKK